MLICACRAPSFSSFPRIIATGQTSTPSPVGTTPRSLLPTRLLIVHAGFAACAYTVSALMAVPIFAVGAIQFKKNGDLRDSLQRQGDKNYGDGQ